MIGIATEKIDIGEFASIGMDGKISRVVDNASGLLVFDAEDNIDAGQVCEIYHDVKTGKTHMRLARL